MAVHIRRDGDVAILSSFGGLLNDPKYFDAGAEVREIVDEGCRQFVFELAGLRTMSNTALALLVTLTRQIRQHGGEAVVAKTSRDVERFLEEMSMSDYWDIFEGVEDAKRFFARRSP